MYVDKASRLVFLNRNTNGIRDMLRKTERIAFVEVKVRVMRNVVKINIENKALFFPLFSIANIRNIVGNVNNTMLD